jgi:hypothetical protein
MQKSSSFRPGGRFLKGYGAISSFEDVLSDITGLGTSEINAVIDVFTEKEAAA